MSAVALHKDSVQWHSAGASDATWNRMYERLVAFREREGHFFISRRHPDPMLRALGRWAGEQRVACNKGILDAHRHELLRVAGFPFDYHGERWESLFAQLCRFHRRYGDCHVPFKDRRWGGLARWVQVQRRKYRQSRLEPERVERLEGIGFAWRLPRGRLAPARTLRERPSVFLLRLEAFRERHGHVAVPPVCRDDPSLPRLCDLAARFARSGELCSPAIALLEAWGFDFAKPLASVSGSPLAFIGGWEGFFAALARFRETHGHARVPARPAPAHTPLARAAAIVRRMHQQQSPELVAGLRSQLLALGFDFSLPEPERPPTEPDQIL